MTTNDVVGSRAPVAVGRLALLAAPSAFGLTGPAIVLPRIAERLGASLEAATWLATVYGLGLAIGAPLAAAVIARSGIRFTLLAGAVLLAAGSLLIAVPGGLGIALVGRALQSLGSAGLVAGAMNLAGTPRRMGVITASLAAAASVGGLIGSLTTWQVALMLPVVGLAGLTGTAGTAPGRPFPSRGIDLRGLALVVGVGTGLTFLPSRPVPALAVTFVLVLLLTGHVRSRPDGFVPRSLVGNRTFGAYSALTLTLATSYFALLYLVPYRLHHDSGWSGDAIGLAAMVVQFAAAVVAFGLAAVAARLGRSRILVVLIAVGTVGALASLPSSPGLLIAALGLALVAATAGQGLLLGFATQSTEDTDTPVAIGLFNLCFQLGGAFGPALLPLLA